VEDLDEERQVDGMALVALLLAFEEELVRNGASRVLVHSRYIEGIRSWR
jgi:hypothetical protein